MKQRCEAVNALWSHLYELGHVAPEGNGYLPRQLQTMPGVGPVTACTVEIFAPPMKQRDIRRLLLKGATAVIRCASRRRAPMGSWLERMLDRQPIPVVAAALANAMARGIRAMLTRGESYRGPVLIGA